MTLQPLVHALLVSLLLLVGTTPAHAQNPPVAIRGLDDAPAALRQSARGTLHVLAVGIDSYAGELGLSFAADDARAFTDSLIKNAADLFDGVEVDTLFDGRATREAIVSAFSGVRRNADTSDTFVFFFAGHGTVATLKRVAEFYIAPVGVTSLSDANHLADNGIAHWELQGWLERVPTRARLIVLDACQSGSFVEQVAQRGLGRFGLEEVGEQSGTAILAATGPSESAPEGLGQDHGLFTAALLRSMSSSPAQPFARRPDTPPEDRSVTDIVYWTKKDVDAMRVALVERFPNLDANRLPRGPWTHEPAGSDRFKLVRW
jgi:uncharacterized caspase-like protein